MYCPRCGSPNTDTTKFCRQCGLGLTQVTGYVASGGTAPLPPSTMQASSNPLAKATEGFTPKQQMILTIMLLVFSPAIFGVLGMGSLSGISAILMPIGIVFTVMRYKAQQRRLQEVQQQMYPQMPMQTMMPPYAAPHGLPQPGQQPVQQTTHQPLYQPAPPPTNPIKTPSSVTEDETRRFQ